MGDGEMNEGSVWEGLMSASKHKLDNLVILIDHNNLQTYDTPAKVAGLDNIFLKIKNFGFNVKQINGHSIKELKKSLSNKKKQRKPLAIICKTIKGKGIDFAENKLDWHHKASLDQSTLVRLKNSLKKNY